jgi:hypothetical protein
LCAWDWKDFFFSGLFAFFAVKQQRRDADWGRASDLIVRPLAELNPGLAGTDVETWGLVDDNNIVLSREQPAQRVRRRDGQLRVHG